MDGSPLRLAALVAGRMGTMLPVFTVVLSFGKSLLTMHAFWHRIMRLAMLTILGFFIWRVPVRPGAITPFGV